MSIKYDPPPFERLRKAREAAGYRSASDAARAMGVPVPTYVGHENGSRKLTSAAAMRYADAFGVGFEFFMIPDLGDLSLVEPRRTTTRAAMSIAAGRPAPSAAELMPPPRLPVYGMASAGDDGRFLMNGQKIAEVMCPPHLVGVPDAYAVYVHGESMFPRYESGETVWVNPHVPPRRNDYVIAQLYTDDPTIYAGYVKRFVSFGEDLVLEQFNPPKTLPFPKAEVVSVHKIVFAGES